MAVDESVPAPPVMDVGDLSAQRIKVPPHSVEAEQSVLGSLMIDTEAWLLVGDRLREEDFYRADHRLFFRAIEALNEDDQPVDVVTVGEWLERNDKLTQTGGLTYLVELVDNTATAANVVAYSDIVRERSVLRRLAQVGTAITRDAFNPEGRNSTELLEQAEKSVFEIAERHSRVGSKVVGIKPLLAKALERIDHLHEQDSPITGVATGYETFDELTSGLQKGDLVIVAGRPSMGKTAFSVNIGEHAAIKDQLKVVIFSMEMPGEQLAMRMMSSLGRIDQHKVRTGKLRDEDWPRLTSAVNMLREAQMFIDDTPALTPTELRARCRRLAKDGGLGLVIVDYLQLMQVPGTAENRATEISEISRSLKALAKELEVPVVALSQLNRGLEQRTDKRPVMSDLRESGAIEQDADVIVFIYRDEVYDEDSPDKGTAEIIIAKQRNGPIGKARLAFLGQYTRFENLAPDYQAGGDFG